MKIKIVLLILVVLSFSLNVKADATKEVKRETRVERESKIPEYLRAKHDAHKHDEREMLEGIIRPVALASFTAECSVCLCGYTDHWFWCIVGSMPAGFLCLTSANIHTCTIFLGGN
jgi:hypothetical protein